MYTVVNKQKNMYMLFGLHGYWKRQKENVYIHAMEVDFSTSVHIYRIKKKNIICCESSF